MRAEQRVVPLRVARTAGQRMVEVAAELDGLTGLLREGDSSGRRACRWAGAIAWRLLVVREMVWASPAQGVLAAGHVDAVEAALDGAMAAAGWGRCHDLDEALADLGTVLADVAETVSGSLLTA